MTFNDVVSCIPDGILPSAGLDVGMISTVQLIRRRAKIARDTETESLLPYAAARHFARMTNEVT
jgi:hypothetical protein